MSLGSRGALKAEPCLPNIPLDDPIKTRFTASVLLNHVFARALHHWHGLNREQAAVGERERFIDMWTLPYEAWTKTHLGKGE